MRRLALVISLVAATEARPAGVSYRRDVQAVLARAGCNMGACHGNLNGKGGFKLSLRGEDPAFDFAAVTRTTAARRVDPLRPDDSLLLKKATGAVPHEGGPRFAADSTEATAVRGWIAAGCPDDPAGLPPLKSLTVTPAAKTLADPENSFAIKATATFADGTTRDVTRLAAFDVTAVGVAGIAPDGTVTKLRDGEVVVIVRYLSGQVPVRVAFIPPRQEFAWKEPPAGNPVDLHVGNRLKGLRLSPSPLADDATFLRRAFLDALGVLPKSDEVAAFLGAASPDKRANLVEALLKRPEFADYWAQKWGDLLRNEEKALDAKGVRVFQGWIRDGLAAGKPLNEFARELIAARGSTYKNPPANLYRSLREPYARAESVAQVFLGVRLQCAKCHNHPFDRWTQDDYHAFAALFARIDYRVLENKRKDNLDKHEFDGEQIVLSPRSGELKHPRTGLPTPPRLLGFDEPGDDGDRLRSLADWVAAKDNPFFAKAQANRVWYHLMGRGIVDPVDDFRAANPPSNPELLDFLAKDLADHGFDLRHLVRRIMTSRTYQRSSLPAETNADDETHFSKATIRPLEAEQLLDAAVQVLGVPPKFAGYPTGTRGVRWPRCRRAAGAAGASATRRRS